MLRHPEFGAPVTLADCEELAADLGEPDGWSVAGRFAAEILPGIFRLDDPCVQLRLAPEHRVELEKVVGGLPREVFLADDSLGWVYQYWQKDRKDEVNSLEVKIGGADLGPVTQLFTENYMVRFLLENSLGAWWAAQHPDSPLIEEFEYLRFDENGQPAAGTFDGWPNRVAQVTVMDPCCGSGHFLVEAFRMLWRMRAEEEGLQPVAAQDAVLQDNLFGLELDPRCVQIAMFAVALTAWKQGAGWRNLPTPHIACSGIPAKARLEEWTALADSDERLKPALARLHTLFRDADTLGSLIDPRRGAEVADGIGLQRSIDDVDFEEVEPLLAKAAASETDEPAAAVLGADAVGIARAATLLSRRYTLIVTNVPYLTRNKMVDILRAHLRGAHPDADGDLATAFLDRFWRLLGHGGVQATVSPQNWTYLTRYRGFRASLLRNHGLRLGGRLGTGAFDAVSGEVVNILLLVASADG
ncbi:DNA methyltransferase, partial [Phytoactinopolyspora endophytica]|uniref:DNA methyltransferase n=1 Tax=Phytoactinopolyspora endophytica TaxID=1642495 RepID=UPI00197B5F04